MFREGRSLSHLGNHCAVETLSPLRVGGDLAVCYEVFFIAGCNVLCSHSCVPLKDCEYSLKGLNMAIELEQWHWIAISVVALLCVLELWPKKLFMPSLKGKHIFLTGASSGIGLSLAKQALREGAYLTLVARNAETMTKVAKSLLKTLDCPPERVLVKVGRHTLWVAES